MATSDEDPTPEELAQLAELEKTHGFQDEGDEPVQDAAEDPDPEEDEEGEGEEDAEDESEEGPSAEDLGEYSPEEHKRAVEALRKAGLDPEDYEGWSPRTVAAKGLRMEREQAEKQTTWAQLQELRNSNASRSQEEPAAANQPPASGDPSMVTPTSVVAKFGEFLDDDAAKGMAAGVTELVAQAVKPLQDALQAQQVAQLQRAEAETFDVLSKDFPDPDVSDASLLDSVETRDAIMQRVAQAVQNGSTQTLADLIRDAARLELFDKVVEGSRKQGAKKEQRNSRRRKGASSSVGLRSRKSESLTFDEEQDRLLEAAEKKHFGQ